MLTGLLGQFAFETQSTVAEDGSLADCANPWAQQLLAGVLSLLFLESAVELRAKWDRSVLSLFGQFAEIFRKIVLNEARATHWSIAVSPGAREKNNENVEDVERPFKCLLATERVQTCGLTFATGARAHFTSKTTFWEHARYSTSGFASHCHQRVCTVWHDLQEQVGSE